MRAGDGRGRRTASASTRASTSLVSPSKPLIVSSAPRSPLRIAHEVQAGAHARHAATAPTGMNGPPSIETSEPRGEHAHA